MWIIKITFIVNVKLLSSVDVVFCCHGNALLVCKSFLILRVERLNLLNAIRLKCPPTLFLSRLMSGKAMVVNHKLYTAKLEREMSKQIASNYCWCTRQPVSGCW